MKKRNILKLTGFILTVSILLFSFTAAAADEVQPDENPIPTEFQEIIDENGYLGISDTNEDDLESVTFNAPNGDEVLYIFGSPVKYTDEDGNNRFKSNKAKGTDKKSENQAGYAFENEGNDVKTYLPERIKDGVLIEKDGYRLESFPEAQKNSKVKMRETDSGEQYLEYKAAMGKHAHLSYAYTYSGVKENIILEKYTGQNEFSFRINTYGLIPDNETGMCITLLDPETGEGIFAFTHPDAEDARFADEQRLAHVSFDNYYKIEPAPDWSESNTVYILTEVIDESFLADSERQYPVTIDPEVVWRYKGSDVCVFENTSVSYPNDTLMYMGYMNTTACPNYGKCIALSQCDISEFLYINPDYISKAEYFANMYGVETSLSYSICIPSSSWSAGTVTYAAASNSTAVRSFTISGDALVGKYHDITSTMKDWIRYALGESTYMSYTRGIALKPTNATSTTQLCRLYSANHASKCPAYVITYTPDTSLSDGNYYIWNQNSGKCLDVYAGGSSPGTDVNQYHFVGLAKQMWNIQKSGGAYIIKPAHNTGMYLSLSTPTSDANMNEAVIDDDAFCWYLVENKDGSYRIISGSSTSRGLFVYSNSTTDNANVVLYRYSGMAGQKWRFSKVSTNFAADTFLYNRDGAAAYAYEKGSYESPDPNYDTPGYLSAGEGGNCTNFVSQCLKRGGLSERGDFATRTSDNAWHYSALGSKYIASYTWGGAQNFARHWGRNENGAGNQRCYMTFVYNTCSDANADWKFLLTVLRKGDVIQIVYSYGIGHTMIIHDVSGGVVNYAQHSKPLVNQSLQSYFTKAPQNGIIFHIISGGWS